MSGCCCHQQSENLERSTLRILLAINAAMFVAEALAGWWSESVGLMADSLDMLADASVYAIALYAVGRSPRSQSVAAVLSGWLQIILGVGVLAEVLRRFAFGSEPVSTVMMGVGALAFAANAACLLLLAKHRQGGAHMRASWIFSTNDTIANAGVILSGALVLYFDSRLPDLLIGTVVAALVVAGGYRILLTASDDRPLPASGSE
jgi:Co/Zn/Cd efflux system component